MGDWLTPRCDRPSNEPQSCCHNHILTSNRDDFERLATCYSPGAISLIEYGDGGRGACVYVGKVEVFDGGRPNVDERMWGQCDRSFPGVDG